MDGVASAAGTAGGKEYTVSHDEPTKTTYDFIYFVRRTQPKSMKTQRWDCLNIRRSPLLGSIRYDPSWRQYVFHPEPG